ncbi:MAG: PAS domain S-box protein, partial [Anaerolineae bacterium]
MIEAILSEEGAATLTITGDPMLEEIAEARKIVIVEDAQTDERTNKEIVAQLGNRTIVNIPIMLFDRHLGSVGTGTFGDEGIRVPTQPEQEYFTAVASHFAVSLDRIHSLKERERANVALRESEERYRIVADNTYDWEFWTDPDGQFLYSSPSCQRITGYTVDQFMRESDLLHRIVHPGDYEQFLRHEQRVAETKLPNEIEFRILHADGSVRYIGQACQPVYDELGQYLGVRGSNRDITERKQAEEALRASEERFSKTFHLSPIGIAIFRAADGRFVDVNDVFLQVSGYSREEVIGRTALELQLYAAPEERDSILRKLYQKGALETFEFKTRNKAGDIGVGLSATTEITLGGEQHYLSLILDITERKRAEEERQAHLWFLESLDRVNRSIQGANNLEQMMSDVLDVVLDIFGCDRAWLLYPCDPEAAIWRVPVERTRPEYPGAMAMGVEVSMTTEAATLMRTVLSADGPVRFDPDSEYPLAAEDARRFGYQSQISVALHPQTGKPWMFGLHQCSYARVWTPQEERLFQEVGRRLADALTGLLAYRELRESEERYRTIFQNAPLGIFRSTFDGRFLEVNPVLAKILGYDSAESVINESHDIAMYTRPEIRNRMISQQLSSTGVVQYLDHFQRQDGSEFIANLYLKTIRDVANQPVFLEGIVEDITEREQAAEDLRKLSPAIEQSPA